MNIPIGQWSGSDAVDELRETIIALDGSTKRQTRWLIRLTWVLVALTFVLVVLTVALLVRDT